VTGLLSRVGAYLLAPESVAATRSVALVPSRRDSALDAVVLGRPDLVPASAAACAGEVRARSHAPAALLCFWRREPVTSREALAPRTPAGVSTRAARRLAVALAAHELHATSSGRLAWLKLDPSPDVAAREVGRALAAIDLPVILGIAGPRPPAFEPLLTNVALALAVLPAETDAGLHVLTAAMLPGRENAILPPLQPGPARWAAKAGFGRLRSLPEAAL
jgi:hypothetical protein